MRVTCRVRQILLPDNTTLELFASQLFKRLRELEGQRIRVDETSWLVSRFHQSSKVWVGQVHMHLPVEREAEIEDPERRGVVKSVTITELERFSAYLLPTERLILVPQPRPRTRAVSPQALQGLGLAALAQIIEGVLPGTDIIPLSGTRDRAFYVNKLKQIAKTKDLRLSKVHVVDLDKQTLQEDLPLFNPDFDWNQVGGQVIPRTFEDVGSCTTQATKDGDLSHNALVRGQVNAGTVQEFVVKETVIDRARPKSRYYKRRRTDRLPIVFSAPDLPVDDRLDEVWEAVEAGGLLDDEGFEEE